jgi:16S rRNA (cytosine1402-N4)-methyltransferase
MHISIMVDEILEVLKIQPGEKGLDATLGYGGHSSKMLEALKGEGHLYSLDIDPIEIVKTKARLEAKGYGEDILTIIRTNFRNIDEVAGEHGKFNFLMADLGVSSMQIDNPERGFTYKHEGPLDLRLDPTKGVSAAERLKELTADEIEGMLIENSDEPYAAEITAVIMSERRKKHEIATTKDLYRVIETALSFIPEKDRKEAVKKSCQRTFQALRIDVNSEFEVLEEFLQKLPTVMESGGRIAILTFHSGEDRLVKQYFKLHQKEGLYSEISKDVIRPSAEECARNGRARSTKLRWAIKA